MIHQNHNQLTNQTINDIIQIGYGQIVTERLQERWTAYLTTFMFNHLNGSHEGRIRQMQREIERIYGMLLTRIIRDPSRKSAQGKLPVWIVCPDFPVPKRIRQSFQDVALNDGLHMHGIVLIPPLSRMTETLDAHLEAHQDRYTGSERPLRRIHAVPVTRTPGYVTGYAFKMLPRRRFDFDKVMILPRARSELTSG